MKKIALLFLLLFIPSLIVLVGCAKDTDTDPVSPKNQHSELDRYLLDHNDRMIVLDSQIRNDTLPGRIGVTVNSFENSLGENFVELRMDGLDWYPAFDGQRYWRSDTLKIEQSRLLTKVEDHWLPIVDLDGLASYEERDTILAGTYTNSDLQEVEYVSLAMGTSDVNLQGRPAGQQTGFKFRCILESDTVVMYKSLILNEQYGVIGLFGNFYFYYAADSSYTIDRTLVPVSPGDPSEALQNWFPLPLSRTWEYTFFGRPDDSFFADRISLSVWGTPETSSDDSYTLAWNDVTHNRSIEVPQTWYLSGDFLLGRGIEVLQPVLSLEGLDAASSGDTLLWYPLPGSQGNPEYFLETILLEKGATATIADIEYNDLLVLKLPAIFPYRMTICTLAPGVGIVRMETSSDVDEEEACLYELTSLSD